MEEPTRQGAVSGWEAFLVRAGELKTRPLGLCDTQRCQGSPSRINIMPLYIQFNNPTIV